MTSQRRIETNTADLNATDSGPTTDLPPDGTSAEETRRRVWRVEVPAPRLPAIPTITAVGGSGGLTTAIATGHVQPGVVWPAVALAIAGLAYDVAVRALNRPRPA